MWHRLVYQFKLYKQKCCITDKKHMLLRECNISTFIVKVWSTPIVNSVSLSFRSLQMSRSERGLGKSASDSTRSFKRQRRDTKRRRRNYR